MSKKKHDEETDIQYEDHTEPAEPGTEKVEIHSTPEGDVPTPAESEPEPKATPEADAITAVIETLEARPDAVENMALRYAVHALREARDRCYELPEVPAEELAAIKEKQEKEAAAAEAAAAEEKKAADEAASQQAY